MSTVIPAAWPKVRLGEIGQSLIGLTYSPNNVNPSGTLVLRSSNIQEGSLSFDDTVYVNCSIPDRIRVRENDILICVRNGSRRLIGKSVMLDKRVIGETFGAFMAIYRSDANPYLRYFFQSDQFKNQIDAHLGATINQITNGSLNNFVVTLPPKAEQRAIAELLTQADQIITILERLIAKKQAIKQGMMQQLLTGRTRLPGFTKEWREVRLGEVTTWMSGGTPSRERAEYWAGDVPWISASTLKDIEVSHSDQCISAEAVRSSSKMAPLGSTLLLVRGSALHKEIRASLVVADVCFNQDVKALVPARELRPKFLTYLIHGHAGELLKLVSSAGNTAGVLDTAVVQSFVVRIPHVTEQQRIISVLDDVNKELTALQHRLTKARNIKTGMMQQLLTGRVRLPVDSES